jgi:hypothetical protein
MDSTEPKKRRTSKKALAAAAAAAEIVIEEPEPEITQEIIEATVEERLPSR